MRAALALPWALLLFFFFYCPLALLLAASFTVPEPGVMALKFWPLSLANYASLVDGLYAGVFIGSLRIAALSSAILLAISFPMAVWMTTLSDSGKSIAAFAVLLPFLTSFLSRIYAWFVLLRPEGIINAALRPFGLEAELLNTEPAIILGIVYAYLPFMVLPIFSALDKIDPWVWESARNLGASTPQMFRRVLVPLSMPGIKAGLILVAIPCTGEFIIAKMLGGGKTPLVGLLIEQLFMGRGTPNWPLGAAATVVLTILLSLALIALRERETAT